MKTITQIKAVAVSAALASTAAGLQAHAALINNGGFEAGLANWTSADQLGSDGTFFVQTGTASPLNMFAVPAPPEGMNAAMTDSGAGGAHILYQDFVVPSNITSASASFSLYLNNGATTYFNPAFLDWAQFNQNGTLNLNQQARVDIMTTGADPFSVAAADILQNLFKTTTSTPGVTGYNPMSVDITALIQAHSGETLRLRFAETDNVNFFNFGVDDVGISVVPAPSALLAGVGAMLGIARRRRRG